MGEQRVTIANEEAVMQEFVKNLLRDVEALEYMLDNKWFETDTIRIGAEQEMCLVYSDTYKPAPLAMEALAQMPNYNWVETELAKFNLETNLKPREFKGKCLSQMEHELVTNLDKIRKKVAPLNSDIILTGILATLHKRDLDYDNLTPLPRYRALMDALKSQLIGEQFELRLTGIDEILVKHNTPMLEACNTSFQVHLQVTPDSFVKMHNIAQMLAAPVMAIGANSPIVFGKRVWHESRIALFQQAIDVRTSHDHMRERSPRVSFGSGWTEDSVMEIYKEDIARFRVLLAAELQEDALKSIKEGITPKLRALQVHNSTVYRWNRPCYGISENGKPHLRIEARVLPAGPTVLDEVANAAFWLGSMIGLANKYDDIRDLIEWENVRDNFAKAARFGIDTKFTWMNDRKVSACDLVLELLPIAREGLESKKVDPADIDKYLGIIEERAKKQMTGARWQLRAYTKLIKEVERDEALTILTASIIKNQKEGSPVHNWPMPEKDDLDVYRPSILRVEEFMVTDLFTVQQDDLIEMVAELMNWKRIRHMPVEDAKGNLVGLITSRTLLKHFTKQYLSGIKENTTAKDIMQVKPITIDPEATIVEAMRKMKENKIGCLPVVKKGELIGMITEMDFLRISGRLIERQENKRNKK
ncbi:MAG: CBS domain-containing protein [Saprospiraceae bacterium]|nr:CBS domain-containing protein [Saprospiraceae bacterium]MCB9326368.1 CBS domain-containing protein [Lewinellaceae bacterium]